MPVVVKFDPNTTQQQAAVIPDASPHNDGVMTKAQAAKLAGLSGANVGLTQVAYGGVSGLASDPGFVRTPVAFAVDSVGGAISLDDIVGARLAYGAMSVVVHSSAINISYVATTPTDWNASTPPTDVWVALDRIAAALALLGQPP
jgi:hypothetical protein